MSYVAMKDSQDIQSPTELQSSAQGTWEEKKAAYEEKLKNKLALLHKTAEEKRALTTAKRGEELIMAEEMAAKYRAKGEAPTKLFGLLKA